MTGIVWRLFVLSATVTMWALAVDVLRFFLATSAWSVPSIAVAIGFGGMLVAWTLSGLSLIRGAAPEDARGE
jgi:hypothetical protein